MRLILVTEVEMYKGHLKQLSKPIHVPLIDALTFGCNHSSTPSRKYSASTCQYWKVGCLLGVSSGDRAAGIFRYTLKVQSQAAQGVREAHNSTKPDNLGSRTTDWCQCAYTHVYVYVYMWVLGAPKNKQQECYVTVGNHRNRIHLQKKQSNLQPRLQGANSPSY